MMEKNLTCCIVVADGCEARIFQRTNKTAPLLQTEHLAHTRELTHEHGRDRPGRSIESFSGHTYKHSYEKQPDWHERQKSLFMDSISSSRSKELPLQPLTKRCVNLSAHTASIR